MQDRRKNRYPTGYHVKFYFAQDREDGGWSGSGAGDAYAHSVMHLNRLMGLLNRDMSLRAEVIPIWGPLAEPFAA